MRAIGVVVAVVAAAGCDMLVCDTAVTPAVTVVVRDSIANAPIAGDLELVGILRDGPYTEQMYLRSDSELAGGGDRPGIYDVEIRAEGYVTWRTSGIIVEAGDVCPLYDPAELTARLVSELSALSASPTSVSVVSVPDLSG